MPLSIIHPGDLSDYPLLSDNQTQLKMATNSTEPSLPSRVIVRRIRPSDAAEVLSVYEIATRTVYSEGIGQALLNYSRVEPAAAISGVLLLNNWWTLHLSLYLGYLFLPIIIACAFAHLRGRCSKDLINSFEYFSTPKAAMFIAEIEGKVVGTVGIKAANTKIRGKFAGLRKEGDAELVRMNILPSCQGYGISRELMEVAINFCKENEYKRIVLTSTTIQHVATQILYPKYGFVTEKQTGIILGIHPMFMSKVL
jgi:GNAT superfamily N-acetyltransferase